MTIKLFADDAKIYAEIIDIRDVEKLQRALCLLVKWAELWQLKIAMNNRFTLKILKFYHVYLYQVLNMVLMTVFYHL